VAALNRDGGRFSTLLNGVIESSPFQRRRGHLDDEPPPAATAQTSAAGEAKGQLEGVTR
jgi:hypothetical protein